MMDAFSSSFGAVLANSAKILAGAVASSLETANAVGPSSCGSRAANSVPSAARLIRVFLNTL